MFTLTIIAWLLLLGALAVFSWSFVKNFSGRRPLPPGPKQSLSFRARNETPNKQPPWKTYAEYSKIFGSVVCLQGLGPPVIVLNSVEATIELLEKRKNFASKPRWPMAELLGRQHNVGFQYYGDRLKKSRRFLHGSLTLKAVTTQWGELIETYTRRLLSDLAETPEEFYSHIYRKTEAFVTLLAYGHEADEHYLNLAKEVMLQTSIALQPGRWLVNFIPMLAYVPAWFPGAGFQRWARHARQLFFTMTHAPFNQVKIDMDTGVAKPSFVSLTLESLGEDNGSVEDQEVVMSTAGSLFSAGTETLISTMLTFFLMMARHPEVQERAYQEIYSVVDKDRLPGLEHLHSLPYVDAIIQEVHRFNPAIPLVAHAPMKDDTYMDYRIPKESWTVANVWAMLHNEDDYPDPHKFFPGRFALSNSHVPRDPRTLVFGFGRRTCPGVHLANTLVYLTVVRVLAVFRISSEIGLEGQLCIPPLEFATGLVPMPKPFRCDIIPRRNTADIPTTS